jgi:hypothetical protein
LAIGWLEYATGKDIDIILSEKGLSRSAGAFSDVTNTDVLAAYALGITSGTVAPTAAVPGKFEPNGQFSRQQAATMLRSLCKAYGAEVSDCPSAGWTDAASVASWALDSVNFCYKNGLMSGTSASPLTFGPAGTFSRQESIITFNNIKAESLPK